MKQANITPIKAIFDKPEADNLVVTIQSDNLTDLAQFNYTLRSGELSLICGQVNVTGEDYSGWDGNNDFPYNFVAENIGVEIIDIVEILPEVPEVLPEPVEEKEEIIEE